MVDYADNFAVLQRVLFVVSQSYLGGLWVIKQSYFLRWYTNDKFGALSRVASHCEHTIVALGNNIKTE